MALIAENLAALRARIAAACLATGRDESDVRLLAMSKTHPVAAIREALEAGVTLFGESRPQELAAKEQELPGVRFAFAGHLQTNKAVLVARHAAEFQALDSLRLAVELDKRCHALGRQLDVLVQVNTSGEPRKFGLEPADVQGFARDLAAFDALRVRGLMTLAAFSADEQLVGACFDRLVAVRRRLRDDSVPGDWHELSMGMSGDFELAIAKGSTCVRVGTAIFGARA